MAVVNQVFSFADDVARYVKACGKRSILECKPHLGKLEPGKLIWLKPAEINSATGNPIARNIFEVPKAKEGWITLTHCSRSGAKGIKKQDYIIQVGSLVVQLLINLFQIY